MHTTPQLAYYSRREGFTTLRVHAVSHRHRCSRWAAALGALLGLGPFAVNLVSPPSVRACRCTEQPRLTQYAIVVYRSSTQPLPLGKSVFCITETLMPAATDTRYVARMLHNSYSSQWRWTVVVCISFPFPDRTHYSPRVSVSFIGRSFTIASDAVALLVIWCCIPEGFQSTRTLSWSTKLTAFLWVNGA